MRARLDAQWAKTRRAPARGFAGRRLSNPRVRCVVGRCGRSCPEAAGPSSAPGPENAARLPAMVLLGDPPSSFGPILPLVFVRCCMSCSRRLGLADPANREVVFRAGAVHDMRAKLCVIRGARGWRRARVLFRRLVLSRWWSSCPGRARFYPVSVPVVARWLRARLVSRWCHGRFPCRGPGVPAVAPVVPPVSVPSFFSITMLFHSQPVVRVTL